MNSALERWLHLPLRRQIGILAACFAAATLALWLLFLRPQQLTQQALRADRRRSGGARQPAAGVAARNGAARPDAAAAVGAISAAVRRAGAHHGSLSDAFSARGATGKGAGETLAGERRCALNGCFSGWRRPRFMPRRAIRFSRRRRAGASRQPH